MARSRSVLALGASVLALAPTACGALADEIDRTAASEGIPLAAVVRRDAAAYGPRVRDGRLEIIAIPLDGPADRSVIASSDAPVTARSVLLAGGGVAVDPGCCTLAFGTAPARAAEVAVTTPAGSATVAVVDGLWLVVLPDFDWSPSEIMWRILATDGTTIEAGRGSTASVSS